MHMRNDTINESIELYEADDRNANSPIDDGYYSSESKSLLADPDDEYSSSDDVEKQLHAVPSAEKSSEPSVKTGEGNGAEYQVSTRKKLLSLGAYFTFNLTLTIYNKAVLGRFAFPWLLTTVHATCLAVGCALLYLFGAFKMNELDYRENGKLFAFSILFTANVAMNNVSLGMVSIPFHQILRATCPAFTVILYRVIYARTYSTMTYLSLLPIVAGAGVATYGDYQFTLLGFLVTLLGVLLAAIKTITTNRLMVGRLKLPPLELLMRMAPLAALQSLAYAYFAGEFQGIINAQREGLLSPTLLAAVLGNGVIAFLLNVSSFSTNKAAGALTMAVAANTKQILTILLGVVLFNVHVTAINGLGMLITLSGVAWYTKAELDTKKVPR